MRREPPDRGPLLDRSLDSRGATLAGTDADHLLDRSDEYLAASDPPRARSLQNRLDGLPETLVGDQDGDLHLGEKVDHVFGPAVELGVPLLAPESLHLAHRHPMNTRRLQTLLHFIQLEGLDDGVDPLHAIGW